MIDQTKIPQLPAPVQDKPAPVAPNRLQRMIVIGIVGLIGLFVALFLVSLGFAIWGGESFAEVIRVIRDLVIIFLILEGILIVVALGILILQVAKLVTIVQTEIKPMLDNTQATLSTVRGTVEFMSENLTDPVVRTSGYAAGVSVLVGNLFGIRRAMKRARTEENSETS